MSADGKTVVGTNGGLSFIWTELGGTSEFAPFGASQLAAIAGVSADGTVVAGDTVVGNLQRGFRATIGGQTELLADPFGGSSHLLGLSGDGLTMVGQASQVFPTPVCQGRPIDSANIAYSWGATQGPAYGQAISGTSFNGAARCGFGGSPTIGPDGCLGLSGLTSWFESPTGNYSAPIGQLTPFFHCVSGDGRSAGGSIDRHDAFSPTAVIYRPDLGLVDLDEYLETLGVNTSSFRLHAVLGISFDGLVMVGDAEYFDLRLGGFGAWVREGFIADLHKDSDGDGLYDDWETEGIPYLDTTKHVRRYMLPGADPHRKDIYIEVDCMSGSAPDQSALNRVIAVFNAAPVAAPAGGGSPGIALHADIDQHHVIPRDYIRNSGWEEFHEDKADNFGTLAEQGSPDAEEIKRVKALAYRYCLFARKIPGALGIGELDPDRPANGPRMGGNDFMIGLAGYTPPNTVNMADLQAAVFMHELGHTLGLYHGGGNAYQNFNPNHYSVMNYAWAGVRAVAPPGQRVLLNYSRENLPVLSENSLSESAGIGSAITGVRVPFAVRKPGTPGFCGAGVPSPDRATCTVHVDSRYCVNYATLNGSVDWDNDGFIADSGHRVCADPNGSNDELPDALTAVNEWDLIAYNFRDAPQFDDDALAPATTPCPTESFEFFMSSLPPPPPLPACPGQPLIPGAPSPALTLVCDFPGPVITIDPQGDGPFSVRWRMADPAQPTMWTDLTDGSLTHGTLVEGAGLPALQISSPNGADFPNGSLLISCVVTDACGVSVPSSAVSLVPSVFGLSPAGPQSDAVCPGGVITAQVQVEGNATDVTFQWYSDTFVPLTDGPMAHGTIVQGSQTSTLRLQSVNPEDGSQGEFGLYCLANCPCGTVLQGFQRSARGVLITEHPAGVDLPCAGAPSLSLHVGAIGVGPLAYRWMRDGVELADSTHISGAATADLSITPASSADSGSYTCLVSPGCGPIAPAPTATAPAVVNIGAPRLLVDPPAPALACVENGSASFNVDAVGVGALTYQWFKDQTPLVDDGRIQGAQFRSLFIYPVVPSDFGEYSVSIANECGQIMSLPTTLSVYPELMITEDPMDTRACIGGTRTISVRADPFTEQIFFEWQVEDPQTPNSWATVQEGQLPFDQELCATAAAQNTANLEITTIGAPTCPTTYRFRARVGTPCGENFSNPCTLTVCRADINCSGVLSVQDIFDFLAIYFTSEPRADFNGSGGISVQDIFDFLAAYFSGCP